MEEGMKTKIKILSVIAFVLLTAAACSPVSQVSTAGTTGQIPQITVTGSGVVYVAPDIAYINVGVRSQGDTVIEALEANNAQAKAIKDTLMSQGVAETDIQTSSFNVYPQSDYDYQGTITRTYFSVENNVYVMVRDLQNLGTILDAVAKSGANNIYGITFDIQDKTEAQTTARQLAVDSAKTQAQQLADETGVKLGEILSVSSYYSYPTQYYGYGMGGGGGDFAISSTVPITSGQIQVSTEVTMSFAIQ
jgi:uncharacterized protein YggE